MPDVPGTGAPSAIGPKKAEAEEVAAPGAGDAPVSPLTLELLNRLIGVEGEQSRLRVELLDRAERIKFLVLDNEGAEAELLRMEAELRAARDKIRELTLLGADFSQEDFTLLEQRNSELEAEILALEITIANLKDEARQAELGSAVSFREPGPKPAPDEPDDEAHKLLRVIRAVRNDIGQLRVRMIATDGDPADWIKTLAGIQAHLTRTL